MANQVLLGGNVVYVPPDLQKTQSEANQSNAFKGFVSKTVRNLNPAKTYSIQFKWVFADGTKSPLWSPSYRVVTPADAPKVPTGFSGESKFASVLITWTGSYQGAEPGKSFNGFKQINIYAGTSATYSPTTSKLAGVLYADLTNNTVTLPVDGTYVRYGQPVYIHASSVNNVNVESAKDLVATVSNGALRAQDVDLGQNAVTIEKLKGDVLVFNNIKAGTISATSFLRAGNDTGARIEISSSTTNLTTYPDPITGAPTNLTYPVLPGLAVYGPDNTVKFRADLSGYVAIGGYTPTDIASISSSASSAASSASTALSKTQNLDTNGNINDTIVMNDTGELYSNKNVYMSSLSGWYIGWVGTAPNRIPVIDIGSSTQYVRWTGTELEIKGTLTVGSMAIGPSVNGANDGIFIDSDDYWYGNGNFSFGNGAMTYDGVAVTFNTGNITFSNTGSFQSDENNYAGDPTITLSDQNKLTLGRRLIYNVTSVPQNPVDGAPGGSAANTWNSLTQTGTFNWKNSGTAKPVKAGDLLFTT